MKNRSRDYYRKMRKQKINRKLRIFRLYHSNNPPAYGIDDSDHISRAMYGSCEDFYYVKYTGMLSKGKIHCSCPMCAFHSIPIGDKKRMDSMDNKLREYYFDSE